MVAHILGGRYERAERENLATARQCKLVVLGCANTERQTWPDVIQTKTDAIADENAAGPTAFICNRLNWRGLGFHRPVTIDERCDFTSTKDPQRCQRGAAYCNNRKQDKDSSHGFRISSTAAH